MAGLGSDVFISSDGERPLAMHAGSEMSAVKVGQHPPLRDECQNSYCIIAQR